MNARQLDSRKVLFWVGTLALLLLLPQLFSLGYLVNAMIATVMWVIFALAFDLSAGHVGAVSLGHAVFFGAGAYVAAIAAPQLQLGYFGSLLLSAVTMGALALVAGVAFFRIAEVSFAIGTLGALIIAQQIANNAVSLTGGPMCTQGVPRPTIHLPATTVTLTQPTEYYYALLPLLLLTLVIYRLLTTRRIGRAFAAVREDEVRASAMGVYPLRYKLLAFGVGGALIGALGSFQAQYITVVCPSELALNYTLTLLIIVFVGGAGSMRGVVIGAVLFNIVPRVLENLAGGTIPPAYQQVLYGLILLGVILYMPDGLDGMLTRLARRRARQAESAHDG